MDPLTTTSLQLAKEAVRAGGLFAAKRGWAMFRAWTARRSELAALQRVFDEAHHWSAKDALHLEPVVWPQDHRLVVQAGTGTAYFAVRATRICPFPIRIEGIHADWQIWDTPHDRRGTLLRPPTFGSEPQPIGHALYPCSIRDIDLGDSLPEVVRLVIQGEAIVYGPWPDAPKQEVELYGVRWLPVQVKP